MALLVIFSTGSSPEAYAQRHFTECRSHTGNNATLIIPSDAVVSIGDDLLALGDEIAVYTSSGLCTGAAVWQGNHLALAVWGDDEMTEALDGHIENETLIFKIWDASQDMVYPTPATEADVHYSAERPYYNASGTFASNAIYVVRAVRIIDRASDGNLRSAQVVSNEIEAIPSGVHLRQNYPNPFNASTTVSFDLSTSGHVRLTVFDVLGRAIAVPLDGEVPSGTHSVYWDAGELPSGKYVYRLEGPGISQSRVMSLHK